MEGERKARLARAGALVASLLMMGTVLVLVAAPAVAPYNCPPDYVYGSGSGKAVVGTTSEVDVQVQMYAHYYHPTRFTCAIYYHYMVLSTTTPNNWIIYPADCPYGTYVDLVVQQPSWSTINSVGTWTGNTPSLNSGGVGSTYVNWTGGVNCYFGAKTAYLSGYSAAPWFSAHFGQTYTVSFTLRHEEGGQKNTLTLNLVA